MPSLPSRNEILAREVEIYANADVEVLWPRFIMRDFFNLPQICDALKEKGSFSLRFQPRFSIFNLIEPRFYAKNILLELGKMQLDYSHSFTLLDCVYTTA